MPFGQSSHCSARWQANAAAVASLTRAKTAKVLSPLPFCLSTAPSRAAAASAMMRSWRASARGITSGWDSHNLVDNRRRGAVSDKPADPLASKHRLQYLAHGVGALPPGELPTAGMRLAAELIAQHWIGQQALQPHHHFVVVVDE